MSDVPSAALPARQARLSRKTRETEITVALDLDGTGKSAVRTGIPFLDHMLELLARHGLFDLEVAATGDLDVDYHHTVEDIGLTLGTVLDQALGERRGIRRYGFVMLPMDESLCRVALDLGGRPFMDYQIACTKTHIRDFDVKLVEEFFRAFMTQARMNLHIAHLYGDEVHHAYEAVFKGVARALRMAVERDPRETGVPSSKGVL
jgi:imidazoleglycerol-phosphate dehydratase